MGSTEEVLTDNGRQYTAWRGETEFERTLKQQGIAHLKARPQHPQTLGKIERFWKTLWDEFLSRTVFASFEDLIRRLELFIEGYNYQRPHQALEGLLPADRFFRAAHTCARRSSSRCSATRCSWRGSSRCRSHFIWWASWATTT